MVQQSYFYNSPVGILHIKAVPDFITAILFTSPVLQENPINLFPIVTQCIKQLDDYFVGTSFTFDLPLQQNGTVFQQKVWQQLLTIPFGRTISYLQLSKQLGDVKAIRAAATANGKNSISIVTPCHRVIGSNGSLVGYAGELWRKRWLLAHEAKFAAGVQTLF
ncbi:MAG: methylated-DNA--[protein]-cysteine S-methyltransferase [Ferruginibacter sp.]